MIPSGAIERCTHCGWLIEYGEAIGAWVHADGRYFCWDTEEYKDPDFATPTSRSPIDSHTR